LKHFQTGSVVCDIIFLSASRPTVWVADSGANVDSAWEQEKPEARKMVSSQYFGVTIFGIRQIWEESPIFGQFFAYLAQ
jgi:hypothetical protein